MSDKNIVVDIDGKEEDLKVALADFKQFVFNMSLAAYEEAVLRFGMSLEEAQELCIPAPLAKEFNFKPYQPKAWEPTEEDSAVE